MCVLTKALGESKALRHLRLIRINYVKDFYNIK